MDEAYGLHLDCAEFEWDGDDCGSAPADTDADDDTGDAGSACDAGYVIDCSGECAPESWIGDGWCDSPDSDDYISYDLYCEEHDFDGGDCADEGWDTSADDDDTTGDGSTSTGGCDYGTLGCIEGSGVTEDLCTPYGFVWYEDGCPEDDDDGGGIVIPDIPDMPWGFGGL